MKNTLYYLTVAVAKIFFPNVKDSKWFIDQYFKILTHLLKTQGTLYTVKYLKRVRLHFTRYLCGSPLTDESDGVAIDKNGIPTQFLFLKKNFDMGGMQGIKFSLTLLGLTRVLTPRKDEEIPIDLSSITQPFRGKSETLNLTILRRVMIQMGLRPLELPKFDPQSMFLVSKAGPHGPSTLTCLKSMKFYSVGNLMGLFGLACVEGRK
jgi:hypothetical protein